MAWSRTRFATSGSEANAPASAHAMGGRRQDAICRGVHAVGHNAPAAKSAVSDDHAACDRVLCAGGRSTVAAFAPLIPSAFISLDSRFKGEALVVPVLSFMVFTVLGGVRWCIRGGGCVSCTGTLGGCTLGDCTLGDCACWGCTLGDCTAGCCCCAVWGSMWAGWFHSAAVSRCVAMSRKTSLSACSPCSFCWLFQLGDLLRAW